MASVESAAYDELLDLFVEPAVAERILAFHPSAAMQTRIEALLAKLRDQTLTAEERAELDEFERIEHFVRLVKARTHEKLGRALHTKSKGLTCSSGRGE